MFIKQGNSAAFVLRIIGLAQSTYYDRMKRRSRSPQAAPKGRGRPVPGYSITESGEKISDEQIQEWLLELVAGEEHVYGYKLLAKCLWNQYRLKLNHKKSYRLCQALDILQPQRQKRFKHPRKLPENRLITGPGQLWQMDIKYGYVAGRDRHFFVLSIIDVFTRVIVGYHRGTSCEAKHACQTLWRALDQHCAPGSERPVIRTDNGPQFVSHLFGDMCESWKMTHERIPPRTPDLNAFIESFHSNMERDLFRKEEYATFEGAYEALDRYMDFYNHRRMHTSLRNLPPVRFSEWVMSLEDRSAFFWPRKKAK
ncbi:IS3 family transposase [Paenibacillus tritici]|uniref:IS3 family transposase n=1 Tax=Paenibacillus tritici TaxID=1873425 RepID=A0ABX2E092_9BACL|nr:IS3 family transposase [Paenibacillus tritici]NQX49907.1 IS3 family transposase [Paenibacillus tritici]